MKKFLWFVPVVAGIIIFSSRQSPHQPQVNIQDIKAQLRAELKSEIQAELSAKIENYIAREVKNEVEQVLASRQAEQPAASAQDMDLSARKASDADGESIQQAIQRTVREVVQRYKEQLSDSALDQYVAGGGLDPQVKLPGGMTKTPADARFELASAKNSEIKKTNSGTAEKTEETESTAGGKERVDSIERTLVQKGSILLPKGQLVFEPSSTYAHFSSNRLNINGFTIFDVVTIGEISTDTIKRDVFIETLSFKYGLLHNLQTELRIPARWEHDRIASTTGTGETTRSAGGLGDIQATVSRQIGWEGGLMPDLIGSLTVKSNTGKDSYNNSIGLGTGHWAISTGLVAAKSSDPAVIFGSLSYSYSIPETFENYGKIVPGHTFGYSVGTAIALSYQTAINFSFDQSITTKMEQNNLTVNNSFVNSANFKTGFNWALNEKSSIDLGISMGLTTDAPDFSVELRFPYVF